MLYVCYIGLLYVVQTEIYYKTSLMYVADLLLFEFVHSACGLSGITGIKVIRSVWLAKVLPVSSYPLIVSEQ